LNTGIHSGNLLDITSGRGISLDLSIYRSRLHGGHFGFRGREQNAFEDVSSELHEVRIAENLSRGRGRVDQSLDDRVFASPALNFRLGLTIQNVLLEPWMLMQRPLTPRLIGDASNNRQRGATNVEEGELSETHQVRHGVRTRLREPRLRQVE